MSHFTNRDFRRSIYFDLLAKQIVQTTSLTQTIGRVISSVKKSHKRKVSESIPTPRIIKTSTRKNYYETMWYVQYEKKNQ